MATESTGPKFDTPLRIGVVLFPGFQALDVFGPMDCFNVLSWQHPNMTLSILAPTLDPVSTKSPVTPHAIGEQVVPTHTFASPPPLDVLLVPGGLGTRGSAPPLLAAIDFVRSTYPSLKYLITVCTGAGIAARAGVLDGRKATTNKHAFKEIAALGPNVHWVPRARWVTDGNIWTASGVTAGIDVTIAWIGEVFGEAFAQRLADEMEHTRHTDSSVDPFAELYGLS
ncbi:class I glutamine amidotransferase-like protein [Aspergillus ellipticus CBS 707.79]|uniref:Class I glutamine amidotransferase-like protein n=1 Tax=Aspergillus ellipticus CBS 707.79 TaxID=1448320 RepID=A0A319D5U5_9EURO|nr:class I glutamine amidotransferase-like protein [Aspergillus ellipticus CBS 707.79]